MRQQPSLALRKVLIVFGGESSEHSPACRTFSYLYERLAHPGLRDDLAVDSIAYLTRDGAALLSKYDPRRSADSYQVQGLPVTLVDLFGKARRLGWFVFGVFYGQNAEDGRPQGLAEYLAIPSNFGDVLSCAISMSKVHMSRYVSSVIDGVATPRTTIVTEVRRAPEILRSWYGETVVVKPNGLGSSVLTEKKTVTVNSVPEIVDLITRILELDDKVIVQEFIHGTEFSVGCIECNGEVRALSAVEIGSEGAFFGQEEKFLVGRSQELMIDTHGESALVTHLRDVSRDIFIDLGFRNAARMDYIVSGRQVYFLEANALPGLLRGSLFTKMLRVENMDVEDFLATTVDNYYARPVLRTNYAFDVEV